VCVCVCVSACGYVCLLGFPEPYIHTVYDRIFGDVPVKNTVYTLYIRVFVCVCV
jgi:hypothetical protein